MTGARYSEAADFTGPNSLEPVVPSLLFVWANTPPGNCPFVNLELMYSTLRYVILWVFKGTV